MEGGRDGVPIAVANEDGISQIRDDKGRICGELGYGHVGRLDRLVTLKTEIIYIRCMEAILNGLYFQG